MKKRADDGTITLRAKEIANMILSGERIDFDALATRWKVSTRQVANYVAIAKKQITDDTTIEVQFEKAKAYNRLETLYSLAVETMDLRTAMNIIEKQAKLFSFDGETVQPYDYSSLVMPTVKKYADGTVEVTGDTSKGLTPFVLEFTNLTVDDEKRLGIVN